MADHEDAPEEGGIYTARDIMRAKFHALGGGKLLHEDIKKLPPLADLVTDAHREMVHDLTASGLSNDAVARCMGISKERLQELFDYEIHTAYELSHATIARSLWVNGVAGDSGAALGWLRTHNRTDWGTVSKLEKTDKGAVQDEAQVATLKAAGADLLAQMLTSMSTDKGLYKKPDSDKLKPVKVVQSDKPKPIKANATMKKVKGD